MLIEIVSLRGWICHYQLNLPICRTAPIDMQLSTKVKISALCSFYKSFKAADQGVSPLQPVTLVLIMFHVGLIGVQLFPSVSSRATAVSFQYSPPETKQLHCCCRH